MYYYIFDLKKCKKRSHVEDIKNHLSALGISGEFTYPSAAYSTEELVDLGLSKKYNTIVGIGGDEIANKIAGKLCGRSEAMGLIPLEASPDLCKLIRSKSWHDAADNLRFRRIEEIKIGMTASGNAFLTALELQTNHAVEITMEFRDYLVQAKVKNLVISNFNSAICKIDPDYLDIAFQSLNQNKEFGSFLGSLFGLSSTEEKGTSLIRARSLRLFTSSQIPLHSGGVFVAKTPQLIECSDENLRLIVGKTL